MTALFEMRIRVGGDPRGFAEFTALREELAKLSHPACPDVDWGRVEQLCLGLFQKNGADLQTAAFFALARSQCLGLTGMAEGVALMSALTREWVHLWPPMAPVRLDIMAWFFAQLRPLLRSQEVNSRSLPALVQVDAELERLNEQLDRQVQVTLVTLQALRQQVGSLIQRLARNSVSGEVVLPYARLPEPERLMPVMILPPPPLPEVTVLQPNAKRRRMAMWLIAAVATIILAGGLWLAGSGGDGWLRAVSLSRQEQPTPEPVRLDSLMLFNAGSAELKPDSTQVLINALVNIKAQPGWLIVIAGHSDATGNAEQNLQLSRARAAAVRDWMQRMGNIPDSCFAVQGVADGQPIASNDTEAGRAANRRVDIRLLPQVGACMP
ncbi:OmpA family protein [Pseudomonas akapageensis]|uniref:OmpA family protein n=1 Tax=Pseudomonas akapageensis TaxID=2609961 RepID=UPI00140B8C28|nr:OmpA family protein [Pseudomonas akapageensis]